jgi:hypothetical protein
MREKWRIGFDTNKCNVQLILTAVSPWQFFCSTRTFSNSLETALTAVALSFWPWNISQISQGFARRATDRSPAGSNPGKSNGSSTITE